MVAPRHNNATFANANRPTRRRYLWWIIIVALALIALFVVILPLVNGGTEVGEPVAEEPGVEVGPETEAEPGE